MVRKKDHLSRTTHHCTIRWKLQECLIKIDNFLEKEDQFINGIRVLTLNDRSTVEYSTAVIPSESVKSKIEEMSKLVFLFPTMLPRRQQSMV